MEPTPNRYMCSLCSPQPLEPYSLAQGELRQAIRNENYSFIRACARDSKRVPQLWEAVITERKTQLLNCLIDLAIDPNVLLEDGSTPLLLAIQLEDEKAVELLVGSAKTDINFPDKEGHTAAHATPFTQSAKIQNIIYENADFNLIDRSGISPLQQFVWSSPSKAEKTRRKIIARMNEKTIEYAESCSAANLLSHVWRVEGQFHYKIQRKTFYRHAYGAGTFSFMQQHLIKCINTLPGDKNSPFTLNFFKPLIASIKKAHCRGYLPQKMLEHYIKTKMLVINTGFQWHAITIFVYYSFLVIIDRQDNSPNKIRVFTFNSSFLTAETLSTLHNLAHAPFQDFYIHINNDLPLQLEMSSDTFEKQLENELQLDCKERSNFCTWENSEALVFIYSAFAQLRQKSLLTPHARISSVNATIYSARVFFEEWTSLTARSTLRGYLRQTNRTKAHSLKPDKKLLKAIAGVFNERISCIRNKKKSRRIYRLLQRRIGKARSSK